MTHRLIILFILLTGEISVAFSQDGETIFRQNCATCHRIGAGRLVGPDLKDLHKRRDPEWIVSFIRSSQTMVMKGDKDAIMLFKEYNQVIMPEQKHLSDQNISDLLAYIKGAGEQVGKETATAKPLAKPEESKPLAALPGKIQEEKIIEIPAENKRKISELFNKIGVIGMFLVAILLAALTLIILKSLKGQ